MGNPYIFFVLFITASSFGPFSYLSRKPFYQFSLFSSNNQMDESVINNLVEERVAYRLSRNYAEADRIKNILEKHDIVVTDLPFQEGGQSIWKFRRPVLEELPGIGVMEAVKQISLLSRLDQQENISYIVNNAKIRLQYLLKKEDNEYYYQNEMQGRKFADAAFEFAISGVKDTELFSLLVEGTMNELKRFGHRNSCKSLHIFQMVEKLAVAGILNQTVYELAASILSYFSNVTSSLLSSSSLSDVNNINSLFVNTSLPLVIDLGCGFGIPLLALAKEHSRTTRTKTRTSDNMNNNNKDNDDGTTTNDDTTKTNSHDNQVFQSSTLNYLGCDMSPLKINYANSIAYRWGLNSYCAFITADVIETLHYIDENYPGPIIWTIINFPTPYSFQITPIGNTNTSISNNENENNINESDDTNTIIINNNKNDASLLINDASSQSTSSSATTLNGSGNGNGQLPFNLADFMITPHLIDLITNMLRKDIVHNKNSNNCNTNRYDNVTHSIQSNMTDSNMNMTITTTTTTTMKDMTMNNNESSLPHVCRFLYIQSNVEDVAITIRNMIEERTANTNTNTNVNNDLPDLPASTSPLFFSPPRSLRVPDSVDRIQWPKEWIDDARGDIPTGSSISGDSDSDSDSDCGMEPSIESSWQWKKNSSNNTNDEGVPEEQNMGKRQKLWIESGGQRTVGHGWLDRSPLPDRIAS
eukprot:gene5606-11319_t